MSDQGPTLHVMSNPSGITHTRYRMEPFNVAALKFLENMKPRGWNMIHYGHESAQVPVENIVCVSNDEFPPPPDGDLMNHKPELYQRFNDRATAHIEKIKRPGDMILCFYGQANKPTVDAHPDLKIVEPSIGYPPEAVFAPFRAFVSHSQMHYYYGLHQMLLKPSWFDAVIHNAFTPSEFDFSDQKDDYFVFLGRVNYDKGVDLCIQVTERIGKRLIIAGPQTTLNHLGYSSIPKHVEMVGYVGPKERSRLLSRAQALMCPTHYIEPFGNIAAEAQFCGTPVIATDWGGYIDSVVHGVTGFRCKDFRSFVEAAERVHTLDPKVCRDWAMQNFSDTVIHDKFDAWFHKIHKFNFYDV